jgi:hypothetical protein
MRRRDRSPDPEVVHGLRELDAALGAAGTCDPALALLVADVRATRSEADPAFLAQLDARVHAGFPRPAREPRRVPRLVAWLPAGGALVAAVVVAVVLLPGSGGNGAGGGGGDASSSSAVRPQSSDSSSSSSSSSSASGRGPVATAEKAAPAATAAPQSLAAPAPAPAPATARRRVERDVQLLLTPAPADVQSTADGVVRVTQAAGGYVQTSSVATRGDAGRAGGEAQFLLRVPTARLDAALAQLAKLAHVGSLTQGSRDITATFTTAADRLADARAERRALLVALGRATTDRQIAAIRARLRDNRSAIARRRGELAAIARRSDLSTVQVTVQGTRRPRTGTGGGGPWTPRDALHDAGRILQVAGGVALVALAVLAPLALLAALTGTLARVVRRRRRQTALDGTA